jgi:hypothetical protein
MIFLRRETWSLLEWFDYEWKIDYFYAAKIRQHNQCIRNIFSCKENSPSRASSNFLAIVLMLPFDGMYQPYKLAVQINCDDLLLVPAFEYKDIYNKGCWVCSTRHDLTLQVTWYPKFLIILFYITYGDQSYWISCSFTFTCKNPDCTVISFSPTSITFALRLSVGTYTISPMAGKLALVPERKERSSFAYQHTMFNLTSENRIELPSVSRCLHCPCPIFMLESVLESLLKSCHSIVWQSESCPTLNPSSRLLTFTPDNTCKWAIVCPFVQETYKLCPC